MSRIASKSKKLTPRIRSIKHERGMDTIDVELNGIKFAIQIFSGNIHITLNTGGNRVYQPVMERVNCNTGVLTAKYIGESK